MSDDIETVLVDAMRHCSRLMGVMKQRGVRRGAETATLAAELGEIHRLGTELCERDWTPDTEIRDLTRRVEWVSAKLLEEITPCDPKPF
jgi:hypothetical protein